MKNRGKGTALVLTGILIGSALGGGTALAASGVLAERSAMPFIVNGAPAEVEAYLINGSNYLKLRDIAALADFSVTWDAASGMVGIDTSTGYTPEHPQTASPAAQEEPVAAPAPYHGQASPAAFNSVYTREAYDALRECIVSGGSGAATAMNAETRAAMQGVAAAIGSYPAYDLKSAGNGTAYFQAKYPGAYEEAADICRKFLDSLAGKSEEEKLYAIACYVCDRLEYDAGSTATPRALFAADGVKKGNCMSYAHGFQFLCNLAGVPCVLIHSEAHQWNEVYTGGRWHSVDLTSFDIRYTETGSATLLHDASEFQGRIFAQADPRLAIFAKEALVPGST